MSKIKLRKQDVYNVTLSIMGGLILVWCLFLFIPMDGYFNFVKGFSTNLTNTVAAYYTTIISYVVIAFEFGFYGIRKCLEPSHKKSNVATA